jgi:hypothetical protein
MFDPALGSRAVLGVLLIHVDIVEGLLLRKVGEARAVYGSHLVNGTLEVGGVEKLTGAAGIHPVTLAVLIEPLLTEGLRGHGEMGRNPFDIRRGKGGCHGTTAIPASQTIDVFPGKRVGGNGHRRKAPGTFIFDSGKEAAKSGFFIEEFLPESAEIHVGSANFGKIKVENRG